MDEGAAPVVQDILKMCEAGKDSSQISNLIKQVIYTLCEYCRALGIAALAKQSKHPSFWQQKNIEHMLTRQEYLGHTVNFKTRKKSFKCKKTVWNAPSEWAVFENTHEAIIDQEIFDIVKRIRDSKLRLTPMREMPTLSGMLFCADCGARLNQIRTRCWTHEQEHFKCTTYRKIRGGYSPHQIHYM